MVNFAGQIKISILILEELSLSFGNDCMRRQPFSVFWFGKPKQAKSKAIVKIYKDRRPW